jgi:hypothetical protein
MESRKNGVIWIRMWVLILKMRGRNWILNFEIHSTKQKRRERCYINQTWERFASTFFEIVLPKEGFEGQ